VNNIDRNPLFSLPSQGSGIGFDGIQAEWSLSAQSPCINAGDTNETYTPKDKAGNPRVVHNRIDLGAFEYQFPGGIANNYSDQQPMVCPNPFINSTVIQFRSRINDGILHIYDLFGKTLKITTGINGDHVSVERGNLPAGIYNYKILTATTSLLQGKLIILDQ
jgi:hypothetical protein